MSTFPQTPTSLLTRIAAEASGEADELAWREFFALYEPAMRAFLKHWDVAGMIDDIVQSVWIKLVDILRMKKYDRTRGPFRAYLATLLYREMVSALRRAKARGAGRQVAIDEVTLPIEDDPAKGLDACWRQSVHEAIVRHVLEETALSQQSKMLYAELEKTQATCADVARRHQLSAATVRQVKSRIERMIRAFERRYLDL